MQEQGGMPSSQIQHQGQQTVAHGQQMLGQQSLFSSQDQLHEVQEISELMLSAPSDQQQMSTNKMDHQCDPRVYHEHCPKHGGPTRSPESYEDIIGSLQTGPEEMVVKESSGAFL